jgi:diaminopimelate epimerase
MQKSINIAKYNASGNDFIIFHTLLEQDYASLAIKLCDRNDGIGADGLVVVLPSNKSDFQWDFYNNDGSSANMCGNASRAVSHYAYKSNLTQNTNISFITKAGEIKTQVNDDIVESMMVEHKILQNIFVEEEKEWYFVDIGVPHLVCICDDLVEFDMQLAQKMRYKYNANVNFIQIKNNNIYIRTYERGVENETLACGTGMSAGFLYAREKDLVEDNIIAYPKSNDIIHLRYKDNRVYMKGQVKFVFSTQVNI